MDITPSKTIKLRVTLSQELISAADTQTDKSGHRHTPPKALWERLDRREVNILRPREEV